MSFTPPACPNDKCPSHRPGVAFSYRRNGTFLRDSDQLEVQRFRCSVCKGGFSEQTFRADFRLRLRDLSERLAPLLVSKVTHRQAARILGVNRATVLSRVESIGEAAVGAHATLASRAVPAELTDGGVAFDELETYVESRRNNPWTVGVAVHKRTSFVLAVAAGMLPRRKGKGANEAEPAPLDEAERAERSDGSRKAVLYCAEALKGLLPVGALLQLDTDKKPSYRKIFRGVFQKRVVHRRTSSKEKRDFRNPLFKVNLCFAMLRDGVSRLVRETWAASKRADRLVHHIAAWVLYRNYVRGVSNPRWDETPAMLLGIAQRKLGWGELLRWKGKYAAELIGM